MKKSDLKNLMVLELRNNKRYLFVDGQLLNNDEHMFLFDACYTDDLLCKNHEEYDVMRVYDLEAFGVSDFINDCKCSESLWERKEKPRIKLTDDEKVILRNLPKKYKYIARDKNGYLCVYKENPTKKITSWINDINKFEFLILFNHLFKFIKWEDEEPYLIEDLLKEKENEKKD